jgi:hypothetical protein
MLSAPSAYDEVRYKHQPSSNDSPAGSGGKGHIVPFTTR